MQKRQQVRGDQQIGTVENGCMLINHIDRVSTISLIPEPRWEFKWKPFTVFNRFYVFLTDFIEDNFVLSWVYFFLIHERIQPVVLY